MNKLFLIAGCIQGALSVMIGAFGAHALKNYLIQIGRTEVFETAVKYQFYHAFALLFVGCIQLHKTNTWIQYSGYSFILGTLVFSGSLYILCLTNVGKWGAVTPVGGLILIAGWLLLAIGVYKA